MTEAPKQPVKDTRTVFDEDAELHGGALRLPQDIQAAFNGNREQVPGSWTLQDFSIVQTTNSSQQQENVCLGQGGYGYVVKATHVPSSYTVALKFIQVYCQEHVDTVSRECSIHMNAQHPAIVKCYGCFLYRPNPAHFLTVTDTRTGETTDVELFYVCMVLEYCPGKDLSFLIFDKIFFHKAEDDDQLILPEEQVAKHIYSILRACHYLHKKLNVIHRDIKPANILIADDGTAKLTDLGVCNVYDTVSNRRKTCVGTPGFLAPEIITLPVKKTTRNSYYDEKSDSWGIGATMYFLLTGNLPYDDHPLYHVKNLNEKDVHDLFRQGKRPPKLRFPEDLSKDAQHLLKGLLEENPRNRLSTKAALKHPWVRKYGAVEPPATKN